MIEDIKKMGEKPPLSDEQIKLLRKAPKKRDNKKTKNKI